MVVRQYKQKNLNIFLINKTTWEDSPDMLLIAATIKQTNTVSASSVGPNILKRWAFKVAESGTTDINNKLPPVQKVQGLRPFLLRENIGLCHQSVSDFPV